MPEVFSQPSLSGTHVSMKLGPESIFTPVCIGKVNNGHSNVAQHPGTLVPTGSPLRLVYSLPTRENEARQAESW